MHEVGHPTIHEVGAPTMHEDRSFDHGLRRGRSGCIPDHSPDRVPVDHSSDHCSDRILDRSLAGRSFDRFYVDLDCNLRVGLDADLDAGLDADPGSAACIGNHVLFDCCVHYLRSQ